MFDTKRRVFAYRTVARQWQPLGVIPVGGGLVGLESLHYLQISHKAPMAEFMPGIAALHCHEGDAVLYPQARREEVTVANCGDRRVWGFEIGLTSTRCVNERRMTKPLRGFATSGRVAQGSER
jgi:hypothetical protein